MVDILSVLKTIFGWLAAAWWLYYVAELNTRFSRYASDEREPWDPNGKRFAIKYGLVMLVHCGIYVIL